MHIFASYNFSTLYVKDTAVLNLKLPADLFAIEKIVSNIFDRDKSLCDYFSNLSEPSTYGKVLYFTTNKQNPTSQGSHIIHQSTTFSSFM